MNQYSDILVYAIVLLAFAYMAKRVRHTQKKSLTKGTGSCGTCGCGHDSEHSHKGKLSLANKLPTSNLQTGHMHPSQFQAKHIRQIKLAEKE